MPVPEGEMDLMADLSDLRFSSLMFAPPRAVIFLLLGISFSAAAALSMDSCFTEEAAWTAVRAGPFRSRAIRQARSSVSLFILPGIPPEFII